MECSEESVEFRRGEELVSCLVEGRNELVDALLVAVLARLPLLTNDRARTPHTGELHYNAQGPLKGEFQRKHTQKERRSGEGGDRSTYRSFGVRRYLNYKPCIIKNPALSHVCNQVGYADLDNHRTISVKKRQGSW